MTATYVPTQNAAALPSNGHGGSTRPARAWQWHWTSEDYYKLFELGFFAGRRVQLINGEIIEMAAMNGPHATALSRTGKVLQKVFEYGSAAGAYTVRYQLPLSLPNNSEPEPDVAVVAGNDDDYQNAHPSTAALVVEISDSTLRPDQSAKVALYAAAGIGEYWIVNLKERQLEVRRQPTARAENEAEHFYAQLQIVQEDESIAPLAAPDASIAVSALLPKKTV
jgi:Uma2 family endonuclease